MQEARGGAGRVDLGSRNKSEVITIRITPKAKFGLEVMARMCNRSVAQTVEFAIQRLLDEPHRQRPPLEGSDYAHAVIEELWSPHRGERLLKMVFKHPELLSYDEEVAWNKLLRSGALDAYISNAGAASREMLPTADVRELEDRIDQFLEDLDAAAREEAAQKKKRSKE